MKLPPILFFLIIFWLFALVNPSIIFGDNLQYHKSLTTYLIMVTLIFALPDLKSRLSKINTTRFVLKFSAAFAVGLIFTSTILRFFNNDTPISMIPIGAIIYHAFVVSFAEEMIFREFMSKYVKNVYMRSLIFASFHAVVYNFNIITIAGAFVMGLVYEKAKTMSKGDNAYNTAIHGAWNIINIMRGG